MSEQKELYTGIAVTLGDSGLVVLEGDKSGVGYEEIRDMIGCRIVTVVSFAHNIDAWCDDEGLLATGNFVNEYTIKEPEAKISLAGNIVFLGSTLEGETIGLNDEQIEYLSENLSFGLRGFVK